MKDEAIYRCIHAACARGLPRRVNFCPYCGTGQHAGVDKPSHRQPPAAGEAPPPIPVAVPPVEMRKAPSVPPPEPPPAPPGAGWRAAAPTPARPPERAPVRLRWWVLALAALWALWLLAKPTDKKIEARIANAVALANDCKARDAQTELIELRSTRATPQQLERLQQELNEAAAACTKARARDKAWRDTTAAVDTALASSSFEKARGRLGAFTRRWGEDDDTRALKAKIDAARPAGNPLALPR